MTKARSNATAPNAKGTLVVGNGTDASTTLAVASTAGYVLTVDSAEATGLKWAAAAAGGKVLQVVQTVYDTQSTSTSTTWADTGLSASITPSATNSKILVLVSQHTWIGRNSTYSGGGLRLLRGSTFVFGDASASAPDNIWVQVGNGTSANNGTLSNLIYLDSPSTTSSTTYKTQFAIHDTSSSGQMITQKSSTDSSITLLEIGA